MADKLSTYRGKRSASRTPEPVPAEGHPPRGEDDTFVIQEHRARRLHYDFRLERDGVLVSWAIPKGLPPDPKKNHLAVHTEDHPLEYAAFEGDIPGGEYGAGPVTIWDRGTYECEKWSDREVMVVLHGGRARGRYVLFHTGGKNWLIHRMDDARAPRDAEQTLIRPMLATPGKLPPREADAQFGYEPNWDGVRTVVYVGGGRARVLTRDDLDLTQTYPELQGIAETLGDVPVVLDGEIVAFDPTTYRVFDLLYLDGHQTSGLSYQERRELLESLQLQGPHWDTPPYSRGGGAAALAASVAQGLEGVVAKRLDSVYEPGRRSRAWVKVTRGREDR